MNTRDFYSDSLSLDKEDKFMQEIIQEEKKEIDKKRFNPISLLQLMAIKYKETKWLIEQLLPVETITAISGSPSSYKTWLILEIAIKITKGELLFKKFATNKTGVLIIDEETGERWIQQRILKLQDDYNLPIFLLSKTGFKLTEETTELLIAYAKENEIGLIIFDSLLRIHTARDENDAVQMAKVFSLFQLLSKNGISTIFTHHNRKQGLLRSSNPSQDMRGSSDILAAVDCHLAIDRKDESITITQTKLRQGEEIKPFKINIVNDDTKLSFNFSGEVDELTRLKKDFAEAIKDLLEQEGKPMCKKEIFQSLHESGIEGGYSTFKNAVQELVNKGELYEQRGERNKNFCSLIPFENKQLAINGDL